MASPLLDHCPPGLPAALYRDPDRHAAELAGIWRREWVAAGLVADFPDGTVRRHEIGGATVIVLREGDILRAFHNVCRHRGAELCPADGPLQGRLTCPYHAWVYAPDGRLVSTAFGTPTDDFRREDHGLLPLHLRVWNGIVFLSAGAEAPPFGPDPGAHALDNWPMADLVPGHRLDMRVGCNWKVFWENYSECLHCPGVHPGLSARVPVYRRGVMSQAERSDGGAPDPALEPGAVTWTQDGRPCGPVFAGLTDGERAEGMRFVTILPSAYVVAHVDHVRVVRLAPLSPTETRLSADWLFPRETLAQPGFDAAGVARFAAQVMAEDAAICELNQRGLASPAFARGRLMPQEFEIAALHRWIAERVPGTIPEPGAGQASGPREPGSP